MKIGELKYAMNNTTTPNKKKSKPKVIKQISTDLKEIEDLYKNNSEKKLEIN